MNNERSWIHVEKSKFKEVVAIDFGTDGTALAFASKGMGYETHFMQNWNMHRGDHM